MTKPLRKIYNNQECLSKIFSILFFFINISSVFASSNEILKPVIINSFSNNLPSFKNGIIHFDVTINIFGTNESEEEIKIKLEQQRKSQQERNFPESLIVQNLKNYERTYRNIAQGYSIKYRLLMVFTDNTIRFEEFGYILPEFETDMDKIIILDGEKYTIYFKKLNQLFRWPLDIYGMFEYRFLDKIGYGFSELFKNYPSNFSLFENSIEGQFILAGSIDSSLKNEYFGMDSIKMVLMPEMEFLIENLSLFENNNLIYTIDYSNMEKFGQIWFPSTIVIKNYQGDKIVKSYLYSIKSTAFNIPSQDLNLNINIVPGMLIQDHRFTPTLSYRPESNQDYTIEELVKLHRKQMEIASDDTWNNGFSIYNTLIVLIKIIMTLVLLRIAYWVYRKYQEK